MDIDARAFGQLEGEVKALHSMLTEQNKTLARLLVKLEAVETQLSEAKGGWKTLVWLGGLSASAAATVTWLLTHTLFTK